LQSARAVGVSDKRMQRGKLLKAITFCTIAAAAYAREKTNMDLSLKRDSEEKIRGVKHKGAKL